MKYTLLAVPWGIISADSQSLYTHHPVEALNHSTGCPAKLFTLGYLLFFVFYSCKLQKLGRFWKIKEICYMIGTRILEITKCEQFCWTPWIKYRFFEFVEKMVLVYLFQKSSLNSGENWIWRRRFRDGTPNPNIVGCPLPVLCLSYTTITWIIMHFNNSSIYSLTPSYLQILMFM